MSIMEATAQAPGDEEYIRKREQITPRTAAPGEPEIAIIRLARSVDRDTEMRTRLPKHVEESRRGEQDLHIDISAGFDVVTQETDVMGQYAHFACVDPPLLLGVSRAISPSNE